ncbi:MAG: NAD(P)-binding protein [Bacteroidota bacterium]
MKRRDFVKLSALSATMPMLLKSCQWEKTTSVGFDIQVHSDMKTGHLVFKSQSFDQGPTLDVKTLIVGGGIAGLSAANQLQGEDFLLCELSNDFGGTSGSHDFKGVNFAQGAHYDLAYPDYYGDEVLDMLSNLDIIYQQKWKSSWSFKEQDYIIPFRLRNKCFENGQHRKDVLIEGEMKQDFLKVISPFLSSMKLPTRLIDEEIRNLDKLNFIDFLQERMTLDASFIRGLDYHMLDDYGGTANQVSALAGIHYFMCRPYYSEVVELFSPPQGNHYFVQKLADGLPESQLLTQHLVRRIQETENGFVAEVVDIANQQVKQVKAGRIVYAGQKHALQYIFPQDFQLFKDNVYAPWLVLNFIVENDKEDYGIWQNEILTEDISFLGFIDSNAQHAKPQENRVLTAYYCLPPESRKDLANVESNKVEIVNKTLDYINAYYGKDLTGSVKQVFMKAMGHAMPIPKVGYLFNDRNATRPNPNLAYAGVDNSRLPLLFDAMDSGIQAVQALNTSKLA